MTIQNNHVVELEYRLHLDNAEGELIEETQAGEPFTFLYGHEEVLEMLVQALSGLKVGDGFHVAIPCKHAYGDPEESAIATFSKELFEADGKIDEALLAEGELVPMRDDEGHEVDGFVVENTPEGVTLDFNHPLAGEDLYFEGRVLAIRPASDAELQAGEASVSL